MKEDTEVQRFEDPVIWHQRGDLRMKLGVEASRQAQRLEHTELTQRREGRRVGLFGEEPQLRCDARSRDRPEGARRQRRPRKLECVRLDLESQPGPVAGKAHHPGRVVEEALVMQDPQAARFEVFQGVLGGDQLAAAPPAQRNRDRIDGEVASGEVLLQRSGSDVGQRSRGGVALGTPLGDVDPSIRPGHRGRAETIVERRLDGLLTSLLGDRGGQAVGGRRGCPRGDRHIELPRLHPAEQIPDGAADQGDVSPLPREVQQLRPARDGRQALQDLARPGNRAVLPHRPGAPQASRTGIPAAAR